MLRRAVKWTRFNYRKAWNSSVVDVTANGSLHRVFPRGEYDHLGG